MQLVLTSAPISHLSPSTSHLLPVTLLRKVVTLLLPLVTHLHQGLEKRETQVAVHLRPSPPQPTPSTHQTLRVSLVLASLLTAMLPQATPSPSPTHGPATTTPPTLTTPPWQLLPPQAVHQTVQAVHVEHLLMQYRTRQVRRVWGVRCHVAWAVGAWDPVTALQDPITLPDPDLDLDLIPQDLRDLVSPARPPAQLCITPTRTGTHSVLTLSQGPCRGSTLHTPHATTRL